MDFAPASRMLYFVTDQYDLHLVNTAAGESPVQVFGSGAGGFFSFSPDGQWMTLCITPISLSWLIRTGLEPGLPFNIRLISATP